MCLASPAAAADCLGDLDTTKPLPNTPEYSMHKVIDCFKNQITRMNAEITDLKKTLYEGTDEVYTISHTFSKDSLQDANHPLIFEHYIYADPKKHHVTMFLLRRENSFAFYLTINRASQGLQVDNIKGMNLTPMLKLNPLQPTRGGVDNVLLAYPENIHVIEVQPTRVNWEAGPTASIDGYILVQRATPEPAR